MGLRVLPFDSDSLDSAARVVAEGGLLVYPTDTVYGLGCDPLSDEAVEKLFEAKKREAKPVPVLCSDLAKAEALVELGPLGRELTAEHWPGALTIVAPLRRRVPSTLDQTHGTLGVRVPGGGLCRKLVDRCGGWLAGTSANLSGKPSSRTAGDAAKQLGDSVDLYLDGGPLDGKESTVVSVAGGVLRVLRQGGVRVKAKG